MGTPYWTAPEIFAQKPYDCKVDVYSYAMTLVEMLLGEVPWSRELAAAPELTMVKLAYKVANDSCRPAIPEGVPPLVRTLIISCRARFRNAIARGFRATPCVSHTIESESSPYTYAIAKHVFFLHMRLGRAYSNVSPPVYKNI